MPEVFAIPSFSSARNPLRSETDLKVNRPRSASSPFALPDPVNTTQAIAALRQSLEPLGQILSVRGLTGAAPAWLIARTMDRIERPLLWVTSSLQRAEQVAADLAFFSKFPVVIYPPHEALPFVPLLSPPKVVAQRLAALYRLATDQTLLAVVAPASALLQLTIPPAVLLKHVEYMLEGEEVDRNALLAWLLSMGYERTAMVQNPGEFSVRGGLLDIFTPLFSHPLRLDFCGDFLEEIRAFDPLTQRSNERLKEAILLPAQELIYTEEFCESAQDRFLQQANEYQWPATRVHEALQQIEARRIVEGQHTLMPLFYDHASTPLVFLPTHAPVLIDEPEAVSRELADFWASARATYEVARTEHRVLTPLEELLAQPIAVENEWGNHTRWLFQELPKGSPCPPLGDALELTCRRPEIPVPASGHRPGEDLLGPILDRVAGWLGSGDRIVLAVPGERHGRRLDELLRSRDLVPSDGPLPIRQSPLTTDPDRPGIEIWCGPLSAGFILPGEALLVVTEEELLGIRARRPTRRQEQRRTIGELAFEELVPGQPVVHRDHGIGLYQGLVHLEAGGIPGEFLLLEYRGGDRLYLPVDRLGLIEKYVGVEGRTPLLSRLGTSGWQLTKQKVKKAIYDIAYELVELYATRQVREGFAFSPPDALFRQFEATFPYEETPHQATAIEEVLDDLQSPRPMDRLICGDVGYGKTEVALRAAFEVVLGGKQVAVLVPTTILAEQHERTFRERFRNFPVEIGVLSRLKSRAEQKAVLEKLASGQIDIVIGTHGLIQGSVDFHDLGLLVIDEEHRFGVRHKERLKRLRQTVDCLTLTATPIPRTLQLSLLGLRDLSVMNTPPRDRLPVKTYLAEFEDLVIKDAIQRELQRGGQIYVVHNRVQGLARLAEHLQRLVPQARVELAHGQMPAGELEEVMLRFLRGAIDCLVCTTIIESGIDIPSTNTIIINRADRLGLADLYQLRGRVGRSNEQAFAYLLVPRLADLTGEAKRRLRAVMELTDLGGGFRLAMSDLQIRGAGNILGISQSGQIAEVGYELYLDLLQKAVEEIKGEPVREEIDPEVNLQISAYIPEGYVQDVEQRLRLYRRLARTTDASEVKELADELCDRYGPLPKELEALLELLAIKRRLRRLNVIRLDRSQPRGFRTSATQDQQIVLTFGPNGPPDPSALLEAVQARKGWRFLPDGRLIIPIKSSDGEDPVVGVQKALRGLLETATRNQ